MLHSIQKEPSPYEGLVTVARVVVRTAVVDNATTFVFSSGMTVTRVVVAKNPEH